MKLDTLQSCIATFARRLQTSGSTLHEYKYDILAHFQHTWTFDNEHFADMYDRALTSTTTRRWWKREQYRPKEMMLLLIASQEAYAVQAFRELLNESKDIGNRIDSFQFYCDEMLRMYKQQQRLSIENNHYQDAAIVSLYLAGKYPHRYTLYPGLRIFNSTLQALGARETTVDDLQRFFKFCHTIYQYMLKDDGIKSVLGAGQRPAGHLLLAHEFLYHAAGVWEETTP